MGYIVCGSCGKETEESDFFGNKKEKCSWCDELLKFEKSNLEKTNSDEKERYKNINDEVDYRNITFIW